MKNIVLIGLPGSGKTTIGKALAALADRSFVDLDDEIEKMAGMPIRDIFAQEGEARFRDWEAKAAAQWGAMQGLVLATGGGAVLRDDNVNALCANGLLVFLDRPVPHICADVEIAHRPLLQSGPQAVESLAQQRRPRYLACADLRIDNDADIEQTLAHLQMVCSALDAKDYLVIGDPIHHSLSPKLHGLAFAAQGLHPEYTALHVPRGTLPSFMAAARKGGLRGFNVTLPHKRDILPLLDDVDPEAALCGAVNTVARQKGRWVGYNTDMEGLHLSLKAAGHGFTGRRVVLLGTGGAAQGVALKAALEKADSLHIAARDAAKAEALAARTAAAVGGKVSSGGWDDAMLSDACRQCDLLIHATPLGMTGFGARFEDLRFLESLRPNACVCDLIYTPPETALLRRARALKLSTVNGLGMLIFQALLAEEIFLDQSLDKPRLFLTIKESLLATGKEQII